MIGQARFDFSGVEVLVTGASRGIGYAIAEAFADARASLAVLAEDAAITEAAERLAARAGRPVTALRADITDREAVEAALGGLARIDVLVNNAGLERITPITEADPGVEATFRRIVEINLTGGFLVTRLALPLIPRGGRVLFTGSTWARTAIAEFAAYVASKHAVLGLVRTLAHELGPRGITVNAVCPGWVRTEASMRSLGVMAERAGRAEKALLAEIVGAQVVDGLMEPAEVAAPYLFLASAAAANVTGQAVMVDRGEVMA